MLLGPEHRAYFINPLKNTHHHLLIKLWTLRQISLLSKIIQPENIRSSFSAFRHDFWRMNFRKMFLFKKTAESPQKSLLYFKDGSFFFIPERQRSEIQLVFQRCIHHLPIYYNGHLCLWHGQILYGNHMQFNPISCPTLAGHLCGQNHTGLLRHPLYQFFVVADTLEHMPGSTQNDKTKPTHFPYLIYASMNNYPFANICGKLFRR